MANLLFAGTKDTRQKKGQIIGRFLQQHALGLTARLAEVINDTMLQHPPILEQRRCVFALEEMIKVSKSYIRIARPQVCDPSCWTIRMPHC